MELPTSLEQRVTLLEQEISVLLTEVWQLDLSLKKTLVEVQQAIASQYLAQQQFIHQELVAEEVLPRGNEEEQQFYEHQRFVNQPIVGALNVGWDTSIAGNNAPPGWTLLQQKDHPLQPLLAESLQRLAKRLPELGSLAADMYFNPLHWQHSYSPNSPCYEAVIRILTACLIEFSPPDICDRLAARLKQILAHPFETDEVRLKQTWGVCYAPHLHLVPDLKDCLELLLALPPIPENLDLIEQLVLGEMDFGPFDPSRYFGKMTFTPPNSPSYASDYDEQITWQWHFDPSMYSVHFNSCKSIWAYQIYGHRFYDWYSHPGLCEYFPRLMERLFEHGRFSYAAFCQSVQHLPAILSPASDRYISDGVLSNFHNQVSPAFSQVILEYCDTLGWETAQNLSKDNHNILTQIKGLCGSRYLLQAVRQHSVHQLGKLVYPQQPREYDYSSKKQQIKSRDGLAAAVIHIAQATKTKPELAEERLALVAELKTFPASSLKYLLPVAHNSQHVLCEALGWQEALPLIEVIASIAHRINTSNAWTADVEVKEVAAFRSALVQTGNTLAREVWTLWREAKVVSNNTVLLIEAIAGWNRAEIEKSLPKRKQLAIKAYGLLPLERGDEVLRYLFFKQFALESKKFGSQRQASEQAAVQTALIYLAQTAGYRDTTRLEWAMEAHLTQEIAPTSRSWSIGDYQIELSLNRAEIQLSVRQGNKPLKSVPAIVRQSKTYVEIKETVNQLRSQVARFRSSFEEIMATGQPLSCDDLISFSRMPIAQALLNQLVLATDDGTYGLLAPDAIALGALDGTPIPVTGQVYIAHPYHLFHRGELAAWQQEIVRQRLVQPFKQAFRELYLLTPAEQETLTYSNRFAGQALDSRVVAKLFQSRGWTITNGDYPVPCKVFPELEIKASFEFSDVGHYISETDVITSDRIYFQLEQRQELLPLVDVPPLIFSEVMRDADLVVSVAQREGEVRLSEEAYQRRGDLIKVLLEDLGLPGVTTEGHFAYVQGKLCRYRVHLGSAAIHIEPGHYLCLVPDRWGQRHDRIFLPFADQGDSKISEVISKVLLLVNDDKIKDKSILSQIQTYK